MEVRFSLTKSMNDSHPSITFVSRRHLGVGPDVVGGFISTLFPAVRVQVVPNLVHFPDELVC